MQRPSVANKYVAFAFVKIPVFIFESARFFRCLIVLIGNDLFFTKKVYFLKQLIFCLFVIIILNEKICTINVFFTKSKLRCVVQLKLLYEKASLFIFHSKLQENHIHFY